MNRSKNYISIYRLEKELNYYPSWYKDQTLFLRFLKITNFTDTDILNFGRIYVKYSHLDKLAELKKFLNHILQKMKLKSSKDLFKKTNEIYSSKQTKLNKNQHY